MEDTNKTQAELLKEVAELRQEITRLKQAELHIQQSETRNRALLNALPDLIFRLSEDGTYLDVNVPADYPTIVALDNVIGKNISQLLTPEDTQRRLRYINLALTSGQTQIYEQSVWVAGKEYYEEVRVVPIGAKEVLMIVRDFTSRRQSEQTLAKQATELETVARVSTAASTILEVDQLLQEVADLTKESFGLYHAHVYRLNETEDTLVLVAGAGQVGRKMTAQGWSIPLDREQSLVARAARTRQAVIVNDVRQEPDWLPNPLLPKTRSELAVPLIVGGQVLGVLDVQADTAGYFTHDDARIQTTLAAQIAVALQNARQYQQTQQALQITRRLFETGRRLSAADDLQAAVAAVVESAPGSGINRALLLIFEQDLTGKMEAATVEANWYSGVGTPPAPIGTRYRWETLQALDFALGSRPFFFEDTFNDNRVEDTALAIFKSQNIRAIAALPLWVGVRQIGTLLLESEEVHHFAESEIEPYIALAGQLAMVIDRQMLVEQTRQRAAELEETTNFLNSIIGNMPTGLFVKDARDLSFVEWNSANEALTGLKKEEVLGKTDYDFFPQEEADYFVRTDREILAGNKMVEIPEESIHTAHKGVRWLRTVKIPILGVDGNPRFLLGISEDITERKQAAEALRASETRNRALLNAIPDLIIHYNSQGVHLDVKEPIGFKTFLPVEELIGKTMNEISPGELSELRMHYLTQALKTDQVQVYEQQVPTEKGISYEEVRIVPSGRDEVFAIIRDITARRQEEAERENLLAEVQRLATIVENHPDFIGIGTLEGQALYINPAGLRMMGLPADHDVTTMQATDFYPPEDAALLLKEGVPKAMQQGRWAAEANLLRVDGATIPVEQTIGLNYDAAGKPYSFSITMRDIRERKQAEAERERLLLEVQEAYRQFVRREWDKFLSQQHHQNWRFEFQREGAGKSANADRLVELQHEVLRKGQTKVVTGGNDAEAGPAVIAPITLRGEVLGTLRLQDIDPDRKWSNDEIALVEAISEQLGLTLENLRLFDDTQQRATREQLARKITDKMRASPDVETIIQTGINELAQALGVSRTYVKLLPASERSVGVDDIREQLKQGVKQNWSTTQNSEANGNTTTPASGQMEEN